MCGIAGVVNFDKSAVSEGVLAEMASVLRHRGPDDWGVHTGQHWGLGHARLSIIDLAGGRQPMHNEDGSVWITFNGEIFNYVELRRDLLTRGHRFATQSDTEVILHLYEEEGESCVRLLNGQWAFAIWDGRNETLFLSRDRLGVRPLFYTRTPRAFIFGSEVKALFAHPDVDRAIDLSGLDQVFTFWCTIPPKTAFKNICELPPGHSMMVNAGTASVSRHWELDFDPIPPPRNTSQEDALAEELLHLLIDATRLRLRADVPVGAYLSGGLDSTTIASLIGNFTDSRLRTFSVSFADPEFDESAYQREASRFLHTEHTDLPCSYSDIARIFPDVIWHTEKPILRTAPAPLFLLSALVREQGYTVVLTGEGADEILGGYDIFKEAKIRRFWLAQPASRMRPLLLRRLYPYLPKIQVQPEAYRRAFFGLDTEARDGPFFSHMPRWKLTSMLKVFFSEDAAAEIRSNPCDELAGSLPKRYAGWPAFCQAQYLETQHLLPGYILSSQGDRVAMAHAVEGRFPFLDHRVVQFASRLPAGLKMRALNEKYLLKRCTAGLIPASITARRKQPYRAPEGRCFLEPSAREYVEDLLSPRQLRLAGIFDPGAVTKLLDKFRLGAANGIRDNMALVGIVSTQLLVRHFLQNFSTVRQSHEAGIATVCN